MFTHGRRSRSSTFNAVKDEFISHDPAFHHHHHHLSNKQLEPNLPSCGNELNLELFGAFLPSSITQMKFAASSTSYLSTSIGSGGVLTGVHPGWCIEDDLYINYVDTYSALVISSYDDDILQNPNVIFDKLVEKPLNLDKLNYLLNKDVVGKTINGCTYAYMDVQKAIWKLIEGPLPTVTLSSCQTNLVDDAMLHGTGYIPPCGGVIAVALPITPLTNGIPNKQTTIIAYPLQKNTTYCPWVCEQNYVS